MNHIKRYRTEAGINQESLAEKIGMTQGGLSHFENGARKADLVMARKIVAALNEAGVQCSLDDVFPPEQSVA